MKSYRHMLNNAEAALHPKSVSKQSKVQAVIKALDASGWSSIPHRYLLCLHDLRETPASPRVSFTT